MRRCRSGRLACGRSPAPVGRLVAPLARAGGIVLAMKGETAREELQRDRTAVAAAGLVDPEVID